MTVSMTRYYRLQTFRAGELRRVLGEVLGPRATVDVTRARANGPRRHQRELSDDDLRLLCDVARDHVEGFGEVYLTLEGRDETLKVKVSGDSSRRVSEAFDRLERELRLEEVVPPSDAPPHDPRAASRRVRCFLSYRFDRETTRLALEVQRFLGLVDVEVVNASAQEPGVAEKVLAKIDRDRDFIVVLVSSTGFAPWTRADVGRANARGALVVPLVEDGSPFAGDLFGGIEPVSFAPGHIGDAFLRLLEAARFMASHAVLY